MTTASEDPELWFRRYEPASPGAVRLLCLPHAGGAAPYFLPLARALAPEFDVVSVQYPGRQERRREPPAADIGTLVDGIDAALSREKPGPLVLFGHSMGAVIGYELARRLERPSNQGLLGLIASGRRAPVRHRDESVHSRDDDGIIAEIRELSGTDPGVLGDEELLRMILPALRADYRAIEVYRHEPGAPLRVPVSVLIGDSDPRVTLDEAQAWQEVTVGDFTFRTFPGGHFYLNRQQAAVVLAIRESIAAFRAAAPVRTP